MAKSDTNTDTRPTPALNITLKTEPEDVKLFVAFCALNEQLKESDSLTRALEEQKREHSEELEQLRARCDVLQQQNQQLKQTRAARTPAEERAWLKSEDYGVLRGRKERQVRWEGGKMI